jgi:hypothetical protein
MCGGINAIEYTIMCIIQVHHRRAGNTEILVCGGNTFVS